MKKIPVAVILLVVIAFIGFGDQVLPQPIGRYSLQARNSIDQMMINLFPNWKPRNPNARTEDAVQQMEQKR
ncbi:hypothetical protein ACN4EG_08430 [Alkalinema pantanalense CENA528]|uniref:hypothetical protein n=1 Tax=Alkalinema pantanalense TaxID=1620705 RepID=UPI003D6F9896